MGLRSNGSPILDGSYGSWVTVIDPLTHDIIRESQILLWTSIDWYRWWSKEIADWLASSDFVVPISHCTVYLCLQLCINMFSDLLHTLIRPCPWVMWVMGLWVMGHWCDGSHGSWITKDDPLSALRGTALHATSIKILPTDT